MTTRRITQADLEAIVGRINRITGSPETPYTRLDDGALRANIGNYHLDYAYGGVALYRMQSLGGGISDVLRLGHVTKRELRDAMFAWIEGYYAAQNPTA